jgi:hypothetical protein
MKKLKDHQGLINDVAQATARYAQLRAHFDVLQRHAKAFTQDNPPVQGVAVVQEGDGFFELGACGAKIRFSLQRLPDATAKGIVRIEDVSSAEPSQLFDVTFSAREGETDIEPRHPVDDPPRIHADRPDDSIDIVLTAVSAALNPVQQQSAGFATRHA